MAESVKSLASSIDLLDDCSEAYSNVLEGKADPTEALKYLVEKARLQREKETTAKENADKAKKRKKRRQKRELEENNRSLKLTLDLLKVRDIEDEDVELEMLKRKLEQRKLELSSMELVSKDQIALDTLQSENSQLLIQSVMMNLAETRRQGQETKEQLQEIRIGLSHNDRASSQLYKELMDKIEEIQAELKANKIDGRQSSGLWSSLKRLFS